MGALFNSVWPVYTQQPVHCLCPTVSKFFYDTWSLRFHSCCRLFYYYPSKDWRASLYDSLLTLRLPLRRIYGQVRLEFVAVVCSHLNTLQSGYVEAVGSQYIKEKNTTHYENPFLHSCQPGEVNISIVGAISGLSILNYKCSGTGENRGVRDYDIGIPTFNPNRLKRAIRNCGGASRILLAPLPPMHL